MTDLYLGVIIILLFSVSLFALALFLNRISHKYLTDLLAAVTILGLVLYIFYLWDQPVLAELLPFSNLVIVGNWFALFTGFLAGFVWRRVPGSIWRKGMFVSALWLAAVFSIISPLRGDPPVCKNVWEDNICKQTSNATCSAACAATLLKHFGIDTTEQEMAQLCLTRKGTHWQGLYRGLKLKTADNPQLSVEVFDCNLDQLIINAEQGPMILAVELVSDANVSGMNLEDRGWIPGQPHSSILLKFLRDDRILVGDPAVGIEEWSSADLIVLWHGRGIRIVKQ